MSVAVASPTSNDRAGPAGAAAPPEGSRRPRAGFDQLLVRPTRRRSMLALPRLAARSAGIVWQAARARFAVAAAIQLTAGLAVGAQVLLARELVQALLVDEGAGALGRAWPWATALVGCTAVTIYAAAAQREHQRVVGELTARYATNQVLDVSVAVEAEAYEVPGFHDRLQRAQVNAQLRPHQMTAGVLGLAGSGMAVAGVSVALATIAPWFMALLFVAAIPPVVANARASALHYDLEVRRTEPDRRRQYLFALLGRKETAAEIRAFDLGPELRRRHDQLYAERIDDLREVVRRRLRLVLVGTLAAAAVTVAAFVYLLSSIGAGRLGLADTAAAAAAALLLTQRLQSLAGAASALFESSLFVEDFTSFVDVLPAIAVAGEAPAAPPGFAELATHHLSYRYPSATRDAVQDVTIEIGAGQLIAIVGENGSGKTTLVKLLAGILQPTGGRVEWDGVDLDGCAPASVRAQVAVILQDFAKFHLSARDNIELGRPGTGDTRRVVAAGRASGIHPDLTRLPDGYDTALGPEFFGGTDLSIGQWQRLALARAVYRDAPVVILDEPTAALDPRAEAALFADARRLFRDKTVLLVSHRLSGVRRADRIFVMADGRVRESGTHDELMAARGLYADLFTLQARGFTP